MVLLPHILISIKCSGFLGSRGTTTGVFVFVSVRRSLHVTTTNRCHVLKSSFYPHQSSLPGKKIDRVCDDGRGTDREVSELLGDDVLQAPAKPIYLDGQTTASWSYGTIGVGVDLARTVWPKQKFTFSSQVRPLVEAESSASYELGPPDRVSRNVLSKHPVDCLLIDDCRIEVWTPWVSSALECHRPAAIMLFTQASHLEKETGAASKTHRKIMEKCGYSSHFWLMEACDFGAAVGQLRLGVLFTKASLEGCGLDPKSPVPNGLPARPMSNLLMPVGVPIAAFTKRKPVSTGNSHRSFPCVSSLSFEDRVQIFDPRGPMPDSLDSWVKVEKGVRRLQPEELAKAKGMPKEWQPTSRKKRTVWRTIVSLITVVHLWTAAMDPLGHWLRSRTCLETPKVASENIWPTKGKCKSPASIGWNDPATNTSEWEVPDLSEGSDWYQARVASLRQAILTLPDYAKHLEDGLQALARHRTNYTSNGPQQLQLLWWEFPEEHWEPLREGCSMNFLISPEGELQMNSKMDEAGKAIAGKFVDELVKLGVLLPADGKLRANCPLFCVDKASQPGEKRCIADCKKGGQNACMGQDPTYLVRNDEILPQLYEGGWSAIADASKQFHNFPTKPDERRYLGCIHPITGAELVYAGLPMGTSNSPAIACRINNGALRQLKKESTLFQGSVRENTWRTKLDGKEYDSRLGHGRILMGQDGLPASRIWAMVDDYFIHSPTERKCHEAFGEFMDYMLRLGFICQKVKTSPPAQVQKFCGLLFDTTGTPKLRIPSSKVSRSLATLDFVIKTNTQGRLSRLTVSVLGGLLQSLVDATPARIGQTYLRGLYNDVHYTCSLTGKDLYYTSIQLNASTVADLGWWQEFLQLNPGNPSRSGAAGHLTVNWGDGSGTGTGGTSETFEDFKLLPMETWMGAWATHVHHFSSNWRELRTLVWSLERHLHSKRTDLRRGTVFYFTDNIVTYYVMQNGSSSSPELHKLVRAAKLLELKLGCRIEVVHVPGRLMIVQGSDDLSRGMWIDSERLLRSSLDESMLTLEAVPFSANFAQWVLSLVGYHPWTSYHHHTGVSDWNWNTIFQQLSIWTPSPELGRQSLGHFMDCWVERAHETAAIFVIPRIMQRDWGNISKHIFDIGTFYPTELPSMCAFPSLIPFCVLHIPCFVRALPLRRLEPAPSSNRPEGWHQRQADYVRGLQ